MNSICRCTRTRASKAAYNLTCGANKEGYHHFGFKPDRDLKQFKGFHDLRMAREGDLCSRCGKGRYEAFRGIEVGQVFKLGTKYSESMNCVFLDEAGAERPMVMGCYGIGITRTIAAVIEQNYDADGIIWPWPVAPYHVHLVTLDAATSRSPLWRSRLKTISKQQGSKCFMTTVMG